MTTAERNRQVRLAARPQGMVKESDFEVREAEVPVPEDGQFLAKTKFISLDPAMRGWLDDRPSYIPPVELGAVMRAGSVVEVVESKCEGVEPGDLIAGNFGVREWAVGRADEIGQKIDPAAGVPVSAYLGALGMPGLTAYFGVHEVGELKEGETFVVSGAAGAVGTVAGQLAKQMGCRVVGIAGGPEKCAMVVDELGFDACIDYKNTDVPMYKALREYCPNGIDVYFDNVGGEILDAALLNIARHGRIVICGAISQYNNETPPRGPQNYMMLLVQAARMQGFVVFNYYKKYPEAMKALAEAVKNGMKIKQEVVEGEIADFPRVLNMLFEGKNTGKLVLELN